MSIEILIDDYYRLRFNTDDDGEARLWFVAGMQANGIDVSAILEQGDITLPTGPVHWTGLAQKPMVIPEGEENVEPEYYPGRHVDLISSVPIDLELFTNCDRVHPVHAYHVFL